MIQELTAHSPSYSWSGYHQSTTALFPRESQPYGRILLQTESQSDSCIMKPILIPAIHLQEQPNIIRVSNKDSLNSETRGIFVNQEYLKYSHLMYKFYYQSEVEIIGTENKRMHLNADYIQHQDRDFFFEDQLFEDVLKQVPFYKAKILYSNQIGYHIHKFNK